MSLITETNQQYYQGAQGFRGVGVAPFSNQTFTTTFDTDLVFGSYDPSDINYTLNNFKIYTSTTGLPNPGGWTEYTSEYTVENNTITVLGDLPADVFLVVQLKKLDGGNYADSPSEEALGDTVENNYGSYSYITLNDAIDNFMVGYVGDGKIIQTAKKSDVLFFAKRSLQEFSYDTLKSIHSQELTIPSSLNIILPQDYVSYVKVSWIDQYGVKRPIFPTNNLTTIPYNTPIQDNKGVPTQDNFGENIEGTSITKERWDKARTDLLTNDFDLDDWAYFSEAYGYNGNWNLGQFYGTDPQYANVNGYFTIDEREGKMSFSSDLVDKLIVLEYISDGLAYDKDTKIPKLAEEALYASILHYIVSTRANQPEYLVQRLKRDRSSKLRNAKIRLSNIKLTEIVQVMRGKSKWIKH
ncbi:MAG: hypothetical protein ACR2M9_01200 [Cyanophyceae cyanobacterium]